MVLIIKNGTQQSQVFVGNRGRNVECLAPIMPGISTGTDSIYIFWLDCGTCGETSLYWFPIQYGKIKLQ